METAPSTSSAQQACTYIEQTPPRIECKLEVGVGHALGLESRTS